MLFFPPSMLSLSLVLAAFTLSVARIHSLHVDPDDLVNLPCNSTSDCPVGTECVAASANFPLQTCIKGPVCGGPTAGNCPVFENVGQLLCVWVPSQELCQDPNVKCKEFEEQFGIYKCSSVERCDLLLGNQETCSKSCNINDKPCNGRGNCRSTGPNAFSCSCDNGWGGDRCDVVSSALCMEGAAECGDHGDCNKGKCQCSEGWRGKQCEISPLQSDDSDSTKQQPSTTNKSADNSSKSKAKTKGKAWIYIVAVIIAILIATFLAVLLVQRQKEKRKLAQQLALNDIIANRYGDDIPTLDTPKHNIATM